MNNSGDAGEKRLRAQLVRAPRSNGVNLLEPINQAGRDIPASDESRLPLKRYARVLREQWLLIAVVLFVVTGAVSVGAMLTEPLYRATGTIEIRKQAAEIVPVNALFQFERISEQYLQTEYGTLRSRALLQRTLRDTALARRLQRQTADERDLANAAETPDRTAARLAEAMHKRLTIDPVIGSRIVRVSFDSPDPVLSADIVNALVEEYVGMRQEAGAAALVRLSEQADSVRAGLLEEERELQEFVRENRLGMVVVAGATGETVPGERLRRLQQELTEAEADGYRAAALARTAGDRGGEAVESELLKSLRVRVAELEGEYARARPTFTDSFPRMRQLRSELAQLDSLIALEQARVTSAMSSEHQAAVRRRELLQGAVAEQRSIMDAFAATLAEYERRERDLESQKQLYTVLQQKRKEAALSAALARMDIAVLDAARPPSVPVRPRPKRDIPLAIITGLLLGIGLAFLRDYADTTVRTPDEVSGVSDVPLVGMIPAVPLHGGWPYASLRGPRESGTWHRIDAGAAEFPQLSEAFRGLRTSVLFDAGGTLPRTILVTSSSPGEGKTTVSANFAISLSMLGHRVLLVDCDMRRPSLHRVFGVPRWPGFIEHLAAITPWELSVHRNVSVGLDLLTAGRQNLNPSDLLSGPSINHWLTEAAAAYDFVILDAPALSINIPDARIITHAVEGVLLVVRSGSTTRDAVRRLVAQTPNLVGIILNQLDLKRLPAYYAEYGNRPDPRSNGHASNGGPERNRSEGAREAMESGSPVPAAVTEEGDA